MGGVAGHAGLFGDARDVAALARVVSRTRCTADRRRSTAELAREAIASSLRPGVAPRPRLGAEDERRELVRRAHVARVVRAHRLHRNVVWADPERDL